VRERAQGIHGIQEGQALSVRGRRTYLDKVIILMEKIEDEYRAFEEMEAKQKAMSKKDLFLLQRLGKKFSSGTSQQEL
jgi:hypothetical protein